MSFGFSIGDLVTVVNLTNKVRKRFEDAPAEYRAISDEVNSLERIILALHSAFPEQEFSAQQKADLKEHVFGCQNLLADLDRVLDKYHELEYPKPPGLSKQSKRLWKRITWEPADIDQLRARLTSNIGNMNAFTSKSILDLSYATQSAAKRLESHQDDERYRSVLEWLSTTDSLAHQNDILKGRQEATGQWFLDDPKFQLWLNGEAATLFCHGIPGAGKTMMTSIIIDNLQSRFDPHPEPSEAGITEKSALSTEVETLYRFHYEKRSRPTVTELSNILDVMTRGLRLYVLLDALDECLDRRVVKALLKKISVIQEHQAVSLLATSRRIPDISSNFAGHPVLEIRASDEDVCRYLENNMTILPSSIQRNSSLRETIKSSISGAVDGMFLLARLHLESLSDKTNPKAVKQTLQKLPKGADKGADALGLAYDEALARIQGQKSGFEKLACNTLSWLVYAQRELSMEELRYALAVEENSIDFDEDNLDEADEIISACGGLAIHDEDTNIVRLVHYTTQDYFEKALPRWAPLAQKTLTVACLIYSSCLSVRDSWRDGESFDTSDTDWDRYMQCRYQEHPFLKYAAYHWSSHAKKCWNGRIEEVVMEWVQIEETVASSLEVVLHPRIWDPTYHGETRPTRPSALHLAAIHGLEAVAAKLLSEGYSPNIGDGCNCTPLFYLSFCPPSVPSSDKEAITKLLLDSADVDVNAKNDDGKTPLTRAASLGNEAMVMMLLNQANIQINDQDNIGRTPLMEAILMPHEKIVRSFLDRDEIQVNLQDNDGQTALHFAAWECPSIIGRLLLQRNDIQVNLSASNGQTALHLAATATGSPFGRDDESFVKMLLERKDLVINEKDDEEQYTPLAQASCCGDEVLVRLLLQRDDIEVDCRCYRNRTALMIAARHGHGSVISILLEEGQAPKDCRDENGETALMLAYKRGYEDVVLLLEQADAAGEVPEPDNRVYRARFRYGESGDEESIGEGSGNEDSNDEECSNEERNDNDSDNEASKC